MIKAHLSSDHLSKLIQIGAFTGSETQLFSSAVHLHYRTNKNSIVLLSLGRQFHYMEY